MKKINLQSLALSGLFAALVCVATMIIHIPTPTKGYVNLGDGVVNVCAWVLGPIYAPTAAGIGSALADIFSGYPVYAPATFVIKALMAAVAYFVFYILKKHFNPITAYVVSSIASEIIMCVGYFLFEGFIYHSFAIAALGIQANLVQGAIGMISSVLLYETIVKHIHISINGTN